MKEMKRQHEYRLGKGEDRDQLWGHERGREIRAEIEALLDPLPEGEVFRIDCTGVKVMDYSFSGELFGKLIGAMASRYPGRVIVLANLEEYVRINLNVALEMMGLLALTVRGIRTWELIGKVGDTDRETLEILAKRKKATAPEIAEALNIKLTTCNQRLRKLVENGIIFRTKISASTGGDQFIYWWPL